MKTPATGVFHCHGRAASEVGRSWWKRKLRATFCNATPQQHITVHRITVPRKRHILHTKMRVKTHYVYAHSHTWTRTPLMCACTCAFGRGRVIIGGKSSCYSMLRWFFCIVEIFMLIPKCVCLILIENFILIIFLCDRIVFLKIIVKRFSIFSTVSQYLVLR